MIGRGKLLQNLYVLEIDNTASLSFCGSLQVDGNLWHQRLGHPAASKLQQLSGTLRIPESSLHKSEHCPVCPLAKQKRLSFNSSVTTSVSPFDLIHLDVWGPFSIESVEGYRYFLTIVDDCTRVTCIYMMRNKNDVLTVFPEFINHVATQYNTHIKVIRSDNAPELSFTQLVKQHGMIHQFSCAYTPQQNSIVERKHQHILNVARALLFQSKVPLAYWSDCVCTAVYLINRTPSVLLGNKTPYELLTKKLPDYSHLKSFGCLCYVSTLLKDRNKFSARADSCVFLGYPSGYKGYKVLHLDTNKISITRNVIFHEDVFPYTDDKTQTSTCSTDIFDNTILLLPIPVIIDSIPHVHIDTHTPTIDPVVVETVPVSTGQGHLLSERPRRSVKTPSYLSQYHCALARSSLLPISLDSNSIPSLPLPHHILSLLSLHIHISHPFISLIYSLILLKPNLLPLNKPCYPQISRRLLMKNCRLWKQIIPGQLNHCLQGKMWLVVSGFTRLNTRLMVRLSVIKLVW